MKREQFEHTIRAAGAILGVKKVLVIGSQAIHASYSGLIPEAQLPADPRILTSVRP